MDSQYAYTPYIWPMLAPAVFTAALVIVVWRRRSVPGALPLVLAMLFTIPWAVGAALEVAAVDVSTKIFWIKFQAIWILPANTAVLCFVLEYADPGRWLTRRTLTLLAIPPLLYLFLILTNDAHHWLWRDFQFDGFVHQVYGTGTWVMVSYNYLLTALQVIVLLRLFVRSALHRWPVALFLVSRLVVFIAFRLGLVNRNPFAPMDPTVLTITFVAAVYALALFRFHVFNVVPVARDTVIERMADGLLVLDAKNHVADLNPVAQKLFGVSRSRAIGRNATQVLTTFPNLIELARGPAAAQLELTLNADTAPRCYRASSSPLTDRRGSQLGRVIVMQDITEAKRIQERFLEQQRALATLQERDRVARELHDGLGQVLGYVKMQAQAARGLLARNQSAEADAHLAQLVAVAQDAHADVREYILGAPTGLSAEAGFLPALTQYLRRFGENYGIAVELSAPPEFGAGAFEPMVEAQLLRIVQEALTNVRKHAGARSVRIGLSVYDSRAEAIVQDDGAGFDLEVLETAEGQKFGLRFMRERAAEVGGSVRVQSAPGAGTRVIICVPLRKEGMKP
jgi:PAS domain S-box-containing protein